MMYLMEQSWYYGACTAATHFLTPNCICGVIRTSHLNKMNVQVHVTVSKTIFIIQLTIFNVRSFVDSQNIVK